MVALAGDHFESIAQMRKFAANTKGGPGSRAKIDYAREWQLGAKGMRYDEKAKAAQEARYYKLAGGNRSHFLNPRTGDAAQDPAAHAGDARAYGSLAKVKEKLATKRFTFGDMVGLALHDWDNTHGVAATVRGADVNLRGDDHLTDADNDAMPYAIKAVREGVQEIEQGSPSGTRARTFPRSWTRCWARIGCSSRSGGSPWPSRTPHRPPTAGAFPGGSRMCSRCSPTPASRRP
jgi:hypothetical protein